MMKPSRWFPTDAWVRLAIVPALAFIATIIDQQHLVDFWHHLARGQVIVTEGRLLDHDIFTYTVAGTPFRDVNWLTQVYYFTLFEMGGLALVQFANSATLALVMFLLVLFCWQRSGSLPIAAVAGAFVFFGSWQALTLRPQTFSLLLFVLTYLALHYCERRPWLLLVPPVLAGLWANLHGAFPAGIMLVGCYTAAAAWKAWRGGKLWRERHWWLLAACLLGSVLATLANPYGWTIYQYVGLTSNTAATRGINEWLPPQLDQPTTWALLVSTIAMVALYLAGWSRLRRKPSAQEVFLILCFLPLACRSVRMIVWWLIVVAPIACTWVTALFAAPVQTQGQMSRPRWSAGVVFALILIASIWSIPGLRASNPLFVLSPHSHPRREIDLDEVHRHLLAHAKTGRVFTHFEWGEYLGWVAGPDFTLFMDGRIEIIPDNVWQEYMAVTYGRENWQAILDGYRVDFLVLDADYHRGTGLLAKVESSGHWQRTLSIRDEIFVYVRQPQPSPGWPASP